MNRIRVAMQKSITLLGLCTWLIGCAHSTGSTGAGPPPAAGDLESQSDKPAPPPIVLAPTAAEAETKRFAWMRPPSAIAGEWQAPATNRCGYAGMVVEIQIPADQPKSATGRIIRAGKAAKYGYHKGEEIIKLEANDFGNWEGTVKWRSVLGVQRWDPMYLVLQDGILRAPMSSRDCWSLTRQ